jgi:polysaccharide biosynthesis/export protein
MVRKVLVAASFLLTSFSVTSLSAQDLSFLEGLGGLTQMQQQTSSALPDDQSIAEMSQPIPAVIADEQEIYRISAGDSISINLLITEDFIESGDFERQAGINGPTDNSNNLQLSQGQFYSSVGPLDNVMTEMLYKEPLSLDQRTYMLLLKQQLETNNPYRVRSDGSIDIIGMQPVLLSGLTVQEAAYRMRLLPVLSGFLVSVTKLPFEENTRGNLSLFGASMFDLDDNQGAASNNSGVLPASYQINPGDVIRLQLYGSQNRFEQVTVNAEGAINIAQIGPVYVSGITNGELTNYLQSQVSSLMVGGNISASVVSSRPIEIFIVGEVNQPGSIVASAFSTLTDALALAGGITDIASIRNVTLIRDRSASSIDLYKLLIDGDRDSDPQLLSGDTIIIRPASLLVGVYGQTKTQAVFELKDDEGIEDLIAFAGGLSGMADIDLAVLEKWGGSRVVEALSYNSITISDLKDGDSLRIPAKSSNISNAITIVGQHVNAGVRPYAQGDRLLDIIGPREMINEGVDLDYVLIKRQPEINGYITLLSADMGLVYRDPESSENQPISNRDTIYLFSNALLRQAQMDMLIAEIDQRGLYNTNNDRQLNRMVSINGAVVFPGRYPLTEDMNLEQIIRAAGGLTQSAGIQKTQLLRSTVTSSGASYERFVINGAQESGYQLERMDVIDIPRLDGWAERRTITLSGEIASPGLYTVLAGETLLSVIERAGGVTSRGFYGGLILQRQALKDIEAFNKQMLVNQLESQLTRTALSSDNSSEMIQSVRSVLDRFIQQEPLGRFKISSNSDIRDQLEMIQVMDGDYLHIPENINAISVFGEVMMPSSYYYDSANNVDNYITNAGGLAPMADGKNVLIVSANGNVTIHKAPRFLRRNNQYALAPGDTILVPPDLSLNLQRNLSLAASITQVIYQMSIAVAAVDSLSR